MIPIITPEIIDSIRAQTSGRPIEYIQEKLKEMADDKQLVLVSAIFDTSDRASKNIKEYMEELPDEIVVTMRDNMILLGLSVYESIRQQIICNELEEQWKY